MKHLVLIVALLLCQGAWAEECWDYKKDGWRLGNPQCGSSCYACNSEDDAKDDVKREYEKYFGKCKDESESKRTEYKEKCKYYINAMETEKEPNVAKNIELSAQYAQIATAYCTRALLEAK